MDLGEWRAWYKREGGRQLRELLLEHWDPIGVAHVPEARDEYDGYIGAIAEALRKEASVDEVTSILTADTDYMGLSPDVERDKRCAAVLVDWYADAMKGLDPTGA